jgi:hypothetical protein
MPQNPKETFFCQLNHPILAHLQNVGHIFLSQPGRQRLNLHLAAVDGNKEVERAAILSKATQGIECGKRIFEHFKTVPNVSKDEKFL